VSSYTLARLIYELDADDKAFGGKLANAEASVKKFQDTCKKSGDTLSKFVTLPLLALGTAAVKFAADAEVSSRKFATAFKGAEGEAAAAVEKLNKQYYLSQGQSKQLLAYTGDLLKGFGATAGGALKTSLSVQQLAASLAAYNGIPVQQASEAITKGLLGETEGLKTLGIAVNDTAIQARLAAEGNDKLTGTAMSLAKANTVLSLAYEQSADAVSSFQENTNTASAKVQQLLGDLKDMSVSLGEQILPVVKDVVGGIRDAVQWFGGLDVRTKQIILVLAALAAAAGPVIKAIGGISKAMQFLMANPYVAAFALLAAGIAAIVTIAVQAADTQGNLKNATDDLVKSTGELNAINKKLESSTQDVTDAEREQLNLRRETVTAINAAHVYKLTEAMEAERNKIAELGEYQQKQIVLQKEFAAVQEDGTKKIQSYDSAWSGVFGAWGVGVRNADELKTAQSMLAEFMSKTSAELTEHNKTYDENIAKVAELVMADESLLAVISKQNLQVATVIQNKIQEIRSTEKLTDAKKAETKATEEANAKRIAAEAAWTEKRKESKDVLKGLIESEKSDLQKLYDQREKLAALALTQSERNQAYAIIDKRIYAEQMRQQAEALDAYAAAAEEKDAAGQETHDKEMARLEEEKQKREQATSAAVGLYQEYAATIGGIIENNSRAEQQIIDQQLQAQIDALDEKALGEEEYNKRVEELQKQAALKKWEIETASFKAKQVADTASIAVNTATGIMAAWSTAGTLGPIFGPIYGGLMTAFLVGLAALKTAEVWSAPAPPRPALAEGAIARATPGGYPVTIGEGQYDEAVLPLSDAAFARIAAGIAATREPVRNTSPEMTTVHLQLYMDAQKIAETVFRVANSGNVRIDL